MTNGKENPLDVEGFIDYVKDPKIIEKLKRFGFFQSVEQKIHSEDQILTVEEIKPGMKFFLRHNDDVAGEITITSEPYEYERGWKVDCEGIKKSKELSYLPLSGMGVTQYPNGLWNAWNWLEKSEKVVSIFRNKARKNITALEGLLDDYFDRGYGSSLPPERQSVVADKARWLVFAWTRTLLTRNAVIDRNHMSFGGGIQKDLEQEFDIKTYHEIWESVDALSLTKHQVADLEARATNLAKKALEEASEI